MKLNITEWRNDCQGKKDYDAPILEITSRYWPGEQDGEGRMAIDVEDGTVYRNVPYGGEASAVSELEVLYASTEGMSVERLTLARKEFQHYDGEVVRREVERWAQEQMDKAVAALRTAFEEDVNG